MSRDRGSILILVIWAIAFLGALAVAVGAYVGGAISLADRAHRSTGAYFAARAAVEQAAAVLLMDTNHWDASSEAWGGRDDSFARIPVGDALGQVVQTVPAQPQAESDEELSFGLRDEERLLNINTVTREMFSLLLQIAGEWDVAHADEVADALVLLRDGADASATADGRGRPSGPGAAAEQQEPPRRFVSLSELQLIEGLDAAPLGKILPFLTCYGSGKVNINTVDPMVMRVIAATRMGGDTPECASLAGKLVAFREAGNVFDDPAPSAILAAASRAGALTSREGSLLAATLKYATLRSTCFRGVAQGRLVDRSRWDSQIEFVFDRNAGILLLWRE